MVTLLVSGYLGDKLHNRLLVSSFGMVLAIMGIALIVGLPLSNDTGRLVGYYFTQASPTPFVALLSLISTNVVRMESFENPSVLTEIFCQAGYTKKTTVAAMFLIAYCVGSKISIFISAVAIAY